MAKKPTELQTEPRNDQEQQQRQQLNTRIGKHVLQALGMPGPLHRVQVCHLWGDHYRVNILVGADITSVTVAHSYFLATDSTGNIVTSAPAITKQY